MNAQSCTCPVCVNCCQNNPGWFKPEEAQVAMEAGLSDRLMLDWLESSEELGNTERIWILAPASLGCEGTHAPEFSWMNFMIGTGFQKGQCTFLKEGLCEIHDSGFKPYQCRGALACDQQHKNVDNYTVARYWNTELGRKVVAEWQKKFI